MSSVLRKFLSCHVLTKYFLNELFCAMLKSDTLINKKINKDKFKKNLFVDIGSHFLDQQKLCLGNLFCKFL